MGLVITNEYLFREKEYRQPQNNRMFIGIHSPLALWGRLLTKFNFDYETTKQSCDTSYGFYYEKD